MSGSRLPLAGLGLALVLTLGASSGVEAAGRQYYAGWHQHPSYGYYYNTYYYKPTPSYVGYTYHYCVYQPSQPRYIYYYNPHRQVYWGRFDLQGKPGEQYSLLADEHRKKSLADIPESAFPKPAAMPAVPDSTDGATIEPPGKPDVPQ
jgi:hypothetical protein